MLQQKVTEGKECWSLDYSGGLEDRRGFPGSSAGKESPAMQETLVQFLRQEDPLEKG